MIVIKNKEEGQSYLDRGKDETLALFLFRGLVVT
jgi:hypothetical protein